MSKINSLKIVEDFWAAVWKTPQDVDAIDRFVTDDFIITTGGVDIVSKDRFKEWVKQFLEKVADPNFEVIETFQNGDGSGVASRWRVTGKNNEIVGMPADQRPIDFTRTASRKCNDDRSVVKLDGIALLAGPVENGSVKTVRIPDRCYLLDLEDDDGD